MFQSKSGLSVLYACTLSVSLIGTAHAVGQGGFSWDEKNGRIERKTVCADKGYGSIAYRKCRARAAKYFDQRCKDLGRQLESASGSRRASLKTEKNKICYAARHFEIVD